MRRNEPSKQFDFNPISTNQHPISEREGHGDISGSPEEVSSHPAGGDVSVEERQIGDRFVRANVS
jgi:hypothetical protein